MKKKCSQEGEKTVQSIYFMFQDNKALQILRIEWGIIRLGLLLSII